MSRRPGVGYQHACYTLLAWGFPPFRVYLSAAVATGLHGVASHGPGWRAGSGRLTSSMTFR